jgi:hypothetical protein
MDQVFWFLLHVVDAITFGWLSRRNPRAGELPDPDEVWADEDQRLRARRADLDALVARTGTALTQLRPVGTVELNGRRHEAASEGGFIEAGTRVEVIGRKEDALVVRQSQAR